ATFANLHYNKFMGKQIQLVGVARSVPLLNKDQTVVIATVTQPLTPLFKVHEAVRIARADERIAQAKASQLITQLTTDVEQLYYRLLIADRRRSSAEAEVKSLEIKMELASSAARPPIAEMAERQVALTEATKTLVSAKSQVAELSRSLSALMGMREET